MKRSEIYQSNRHNNDPRYARMTFGKYQGRYIKELPDDYLKWAVLNISDQAMATFLSEELTKRKLI